MYQSMTQLPNQKPVVSNVEPSQIRNPIPTKAQTSLFVYRDEILRDFKSEIRGFFFFLLPFYFLLLISCEKNTTPVTLPNPQLTLTVEDVAVTEAWLHLTVEDRTENLRFALLRDDSLILNGQLTTNDTTLYDSTLLPAHTYTYRTELQKEGQKIAAAGPVSIATMDTTSHNFTWQIDTIGDGNSSVMRDVFIIDENDIWAVGEIYVSNDSTPWRPYSAAHWNGQEWELKRFTYISNNSELVIAPVRGVWVLSNDDIWLAAGSIFHWDGNIATLSYQRNINTQETIEKLWINSSSEIYGVGNEGLMVYYTGNSWYRIYTGIDLPIQDIWGATDSKTGETTILCPASEKYYASEKKIIQIEPETKRISFEDWPFLDRSIHSIWFKNRRSIWLCGDGVFVERSGQWKRFTELPSIFKNRIRGTDLNDIFVVGDFGLVAHFNGFTWKVFPEVNVALYRSVDYKAGLMVAVGGRNARGIILRMRR